jgi:hypothetical protein
MTGGDQLGNDPSPDDATGAGNENSQTAPPENQLQME